MTCRMCKGWGVVRAAGRHKGLPYYTENGARSAKASMPCPKCSVRPHAYVRHEEDRSVECTSCHVVFTTLAQLEAAGPCPALVTTS